MTSTASPDQLYWGLEPRSSEKGAAFRVSVSDRVDRVLVHLSADGTLVTKVSPGMLERLGLSDTDATAVGFENLDRELRKAQFGCDCIDEVEVSFFDTAFSLRSSLMLSQVLKAVVGPASWPLTAITPSRDFHYFWPSRDSRIASRVRAVAMDHFSNDRSPISTEIYEFSDTGIRVVGELSKSP